jgi:hydrogenase assembly chaperone HypC/HupF
MCVTLVARVLSIDDGDGVASVQTVDRTIVVSLAPIVLDGGRVAPGDHVLVHTGLAVAVLDEATARDLASWAAPAPTPAAGKEGNHDPGR